MNRLRALLARPCGPVAGNWTLADGLAMLACGLLAVALMIASLATTLA